MSTEDDEDGDKIQEYREVSPCAGESQVCQELFS